MIRQETAGRFTYEVMVIDDASTDDTPEVVQRVKKKSPIPVRYILGEGRGYTRVLNTAVLKFRGEWLVIFDDDQLTGPTWLFGLFEAAVKQGADIVGGPIVLDLADEVLAGIGPVCRDLYGETSDRRNPELFESQHPLPPGGNRLIHRRVFEKIGAFDDSMLTGGCDRDFILRAQAAKIPFGWAYASSGLHLISEHRFTFEHVKWYSLQWGCSFAHIDGKRFGIKQTLFLCVARIGQALLVTLPLLVRAKITGNSSEIRDRKALLWRAVGYTRKTLQLLAPGVFRQKRFFSQVEFRRGRRQTKQPPTASGWV